MKENRNIKTRIIAVLFMLSVVFTASTFAYWANYIEGTSSEANGTLQVGSGTTVSTIFELSDELNSGGLLVPQNQQDNSGIGSVEYINLIHSLAWNENNDTLQLSGTDTLGLVGVQHSVTITQNGIDLPFEEYEDLYSLIKVEYNISNPSSLKLNGDSETFVYQVTLEEPSNQETYNLISNASISIEFSYVISEKNITTKDLNNTVLIIEETDEQYFTVSRTSDDKIIAYDLEGGLDVVIPKELNGVAITTIGDNSFLREGINSVVLQEGITLIGTNAFHSNNLTSVIIPSTVELISYNAFNNNNLTSVEFGEGLEVIRAGAFSDNNITTVNLPDSVVEVAAGAFGYGGNFITEITLGDNVKIGSVTSFGWYGSTFKTFYNQNKQAGTYVYVNGEWNIQD